MKKYSLVNKSGESITTINADSFDYKAFMEAETK